MNEEELREEGEGAGSRGRGRAERRGLERTSGIQVGSQRIWKMGLLASEMPVMSVKVYCDGSVARKVTKRWFFVAQFLMICSASSIFSTKK